jgi:hypothetical protein
MNRERERYRANERATCRWAALKRVSNVTTVPSRVTSFERSSDTRRDYGSEERRVTVEYSNERVLASLTLRVRTCCSWKKDEKHSPRFGVNTCNRE